VEYAGVENTGAERYGKPFIQKFLTDEAGIDSSGGKCKSGKYMQSRPYRNIGRSKLESVCV